MVYYKQILTILDAKQLIEVLSEAVIQYHGLPDSIVTNQGFLFTSKF